MFKFKKGDRLRCIEDTRAHLIEGDVYTVSMCCRWDDDQGVGPGYHLRDAYYTNYAYEEKRFEYAKISNRERIAKRMEELNNV